MLVYDVCFLAHTQAVEVPLAQAGEVLGNLWAVCCSPELGRCVLPFLLSAGEVDVRVCVGSRMRRGRCCRPRPRRASRSTLRSSCRRLRRTRRGRRRGARAGASAGRSGSWRRRRTGGILSRRIRLIMERMLYFPLGGKEPSSGLLKDRLACTL